MSFSTKHIPAKVAAIAIAIAVCLSSCHRQDLEYEFLETCLIPVSIDWTDAQLDPATDNENLYRASAWFFRTDGKLFDDGKPYREFRFNNALGGEVELPVGKYSVLIFNNSVSEFTAAVNFRNTESYDSFEYYVMPDEARRSGNNPVLEPDILAAWRLPDYEVTREMAVVRHQVGTSITEQQSQKAQQDLKRLVGVKPQRLTYKMRVRAHVANLNNAVSCRATFEGMAHQVKLADKSVSETSSAFNFTLNNRRFDEGSTTDGTIEAVFYTLGPLAREDAPYYIHLSFTLAEPYEGSSTYPANSVLTFDISQQVRDSWAATRGDADVPSIDEDISSDIVLPIEVVVEIDLPKHITDAFDVWVDDWGDEEWHNVPIN